jgi:RND family efflux transporter MFP subunit
MNDDTRTDESSGERPRRWPWLLAGLAILALGAAAFWYLTRPDATGEAATTQAPLVRVAQARPVEELTITQTGFVRPRAEVAVSPEISGRIAAVADRFTLGARVAEGALLLRLDDATFEADVAQGEAAVEQAKAALAEAEVNRERQAQLEEEGFAAEQRLQQALVRVARAEADLARAQAELTGARQRLEDTAVRAPFDALVTQEAAAVGQLVQPGTVIGRLIAADSVRVQMGLLPGDLDLLGAADAALGREIRLFGTGPQGAALGTGTVIDIDPRIEEQTRTVALVVEVPDPFDGPGTRPLRIGELVELRLPVTPPGGTALVLPPEALKGGDTLWRVADGRLQRLAPTVLRRAEGRIAVTAEGLSAGDRVMLSDLPATAEGVKVRVAQGAREGAEE